MTATAPAKITYTSANVDLTAFHADFDAALARVRSETGRFHPFHIGRVAVETPATRLEDRSPTDTGLLLGSFSAAGPEHVDQAVQAAKRAQPDWARRSWRDRVQILRRAAVLIRERKFRLAAIMTLEVGKNRLEAMGDAEEAADLIDYYCHQVEESDGFRLPMANPTAIERNLDVLRPYGVFVCIAPFNFPLALSAGMSSAALVCGNAVVYKPAEDTPWIGRELWEIYREAGVPDGVVNHLTGLREVIGDPLWQHPLVDGVVFTGSRAVGMRIYHGLSARYVKPCLMELGGKNAAVVMESADLDAAAEGIVRSAFGLSGQKCSATSRSYVHRAVAEGFLERLLERTRAIRAGDPAERDVWFGPVINARALARFDAAAALARRDGEILIGGERLQGERFDRGHYVEPTVARVPLESELHREEFFVPVLAVTVVDSLDQAIAETNRPDYGLTAGIFSGRADEVERFFDEVEAGVCYANKRSGATTGAWPGAQAFCGWKGSGSTGKGGCGPWYVQQFMREQSRTVITG